MPGASQPSTTNKRLGHLRTEGEFKRFSFAMPGLISPNTICHGGLFTYLVVFSVITLTTAVSFDLTELRNKVAKIKVNPRGNLWATGHFMGKKSVMDKPLLSSADDGGALVGLLGPEQADLEELFQGVLRVALQLQATQIDTKETLVSKNQETELLMKILESYIHNNIK